MRSRIKAHRSVEARQIEDLYLPHFNLGAHTNATHDHVIAAERASQKRARVAAACLVQ